MPKIRLIHGPLQKRKKTLELEQVVKSILANPINTCFEAVLDIRTGKLSDFLIATADDCYSLRDLLKNADLEHFHLDAEDIENYDTFLKSSSLKYTPLITNTSWLAKFGLGERTIVLSDEVIAEKKRRHQLSENLIAFRNGSLKAINIYTGEAHHTINKLISCSFDRIVEKREGILECFLAGMVTISAVNEPLAGGKTAVVKESFFNRRPRLYRGEGSDRFLQEFRKENPTLELGVSVEKECKQISSFSESEGAARKFGYNATLRTKVIVEVSECRGLDISTISLYPEEKEILRITPKTFLSCEGISCFGMRFKSTPISALGIEEVDSEDEEEQGAVFKV